MKLRNVLLAPLSWLYALAIFGRNQLYARRVFRQKRLPCPVISVGNLIAGGTGKTPAVIAIAKLLHTEGIRVAILLRGYKRNSRDKVTIVSDGKGKLATPTESGDEAHMIARHLKGIPVIVGKHRYLSGQLALERLGVDALLLDDGYQHRQLARDLDILTVPAPHPFGNPPKLLPAGLLREPPTALQRADILLLTHTDTPEISAYTAVKQFAPDALILESVHQPTHLYPLIREDSRERQDIAELKGKRLLAVCGIGSPDSFAATLTRCSAESVNLLSFPDHHVYTETDMKRISAAFQETQADMIVTTQKDEQKLDALAEPPKIPIFVLAIELVITEGTEKLVDVLRETCFSFPLDKGGRGVVSS